MKWIPWLAMLAGGLWCAGHWPSVRAEEPLRLGQLFHESASARGELEPLGAAVASGDVVRSVNRSALLRLDNGHVLKFTANSSALIEGLASEGVKLTVLSGRLLMFGPKGRLLVAGSGSTFRRLPTYADSAAAEERLMGLDPSQEAARHEREED